MPLRSTLVALGLLGSVSRAAPDAGAHVAPLELRRNMPFVQVLVNGKGPFTFGIDTGTGTEGLVSPALVHTLGLSAGGGTVEAGDPSGRATRQLPLVRLATLSVAGIDFRDVTAAVFEPSQAEGRCDGILGFTLFRDRLLTLDYPGARLVLGDGRLTASKDGTVVPFRAPNAVPVVDLVIGAETVPAAIDSRGSGLAIPAAQAERLPVLGAPVVVGRGRTISGEFELRGVQLADDVQLGGYRIRQPFVVLHPGFPIGNVGGLVLRQLVLTFDQRSMLLRLEAPERTLVLPRPQPRPAPGSSDGGAPPSR